MKRSASVIGLDCSGRTLRAVRACRRGGAMAIQGSTSVRRSTTDGPPDADDLRRLQAAMVRSGVGTQDIMASMPREFLAVASLDLSKNSSLTETRRSAVAELARLLDAPSDAIEVAWTSMPARRGGGREIAITGCAHTAAQEFITACADAGLEIVGLQPETRAVVRLLGRSEPRATKDSDQPCEPRNELQAGVIIEWQRATVIVTDGDEPAFERVLPASGLEGLAQALLAHLPTDDAEVAEHLLFTRGLEADDDDGMCSIVHAAVAAPMNALLNEIERTVRYASARFRQRSVRRVTVYGEGACIPGLEKAIAERLETADAPRATTVEPTLAIALGLAEAAS